MYLPPEITEEILVNLSVKSLLRFKCVCKSWNSLITSRRFIRRHYSNSSNQSCLLIYLFNDDPERCSFSIYDASNHPRLQESNLLAQMPTSRGFCALWGPENGVFCAVFLSGNIFLSNPAMRELRLLPRTPFLIIQHMMGFGFGPSTGDQKVVAFGLYDAAACVYSSSSDSWRRIEIHRSKFWSIGTIICEAFFNGVYYWCMDYRDNLSSVTGILAFDMKSERFQESQVPEYIPLLRSSLLRMVEYGDAIAVFCVDDDDMWVMGKDGIWSRRKKDLLTEARLLLIEERHEIEARIGRSLPEVNVYSYKESLVSVKGGRGDAAFLQDLFHERSGYRIC